MRIFLFKSFMKRIFSRLFIKLKRREKSSALNRKINKEKSGEERNRKKKIITVTMRIFRINEKRGYIKIDKKIYICRE